MNSNTLFFYQGLCFGSDEGDRRSEASSGGSKIIGDITIAEYEGSPRRYRPRASPPQPEKKSQQQRPPLRLPGFPQRVLPAVPTDTSEAEKTEELLKFEEEAPSKKEDESFRYEFSETRKVLDEFFHEKVEEEKNFNDLNYVLRKNNNYVVGQRLASEEVESKTLQEDLMLTTPVKEPTSQTSNSLDVVIAAASKGPIVGVSPLDQPLVNFGMSLKSPCVEENDIIEDVKPGLHSKF